MKKKRQRSNQRKHRIDTMLDIPEEVTSKEPKITILGFKKLLIENYQGILEYQDFYIRIKMYTGLININGFNMCLTEMTTDDIMVTGKIESVDFEQTNV